MQKNPVRLTTFVVLFLAILFTWTTPMATAQELSAKTMYTLSTGAGLSAIQPDKNMQSVKQGPTPLLTRVNTLERWNLVYQQNTSMPLVSSVQYHPDLHVFVSGTELAPVLVTTAPPTLTKPVPSTGQIQGTAVAEPVVAQVVSATPQPKAGTSITINKTQPVTAQKPAAVTVKPATVTVGKPAPVALAPSELDGLFEKYGAEYGLSATMLKYIAKCESGLNPAALSKNGLYGGLFQFVASTWSSNRRALGLDPDPALRFNAEEAIKTAAFKISRDGVGAWPVCGRKATATLASAAL